MPSTHFPHTAPPAKPTNFQSSPADARLRLQSHRLNYSSCLHFSPHFFLASFHHPRLYLVCPLHNYPAWKSIRLKKQCYIQQSKCPRASSSSPEQNAGSVQPGPPRSGHSETLAVQERRREKQKQKQGMSVTGKDGVGRCGVGVVGSRRDVDGTSACDYTLAWCHCVLYFRHLPLLPSRRAGGVEGLPWLS